MFDIGFMELVLTAVIALVVIGPKRLPETVRTVGLWVGRTKRALNRAYKEMDRELGLDDIRRQLHNEEVMRSLEEHKKRLEAEILGNSKAEDAKADKSEMDSGEADTGGTPLASASGPSSAPATSAEATSTGDISDQSTDAPATRKDDRHE